MGPRLRAAVPPGFQFHDPCSVSSSRRRAESEFLGRSEAYERSIFRDSGSRDAPSDPKALPARGGEGSISGTTGNTPAPAAGSAAIAPSSAAGRARSALASAAGSDPRASASATAGPGPVAPGEAPSSHRGRRRRGHRPDAGWRNRAQRVRSRTIELSPGGRREVAAVSPADGPGAPGCRWIGSGDPLRRVWVGFGNGLPGSHSTGTAAGAGEEKVSQAQANGRQLQGSGGWSGHPPARAAGSRLNQARGIHTRAFGCRQQGAGAEESAEGCGQAVRR